MNNNMTTAPENRPAREQRRAYLHPHVNVVETRDGYVLEAEMPGVGKEGLEILLEGNQLTIIGHRADSLSAQLLYRESLDRDFRRSFELDPAIDSGRIVARMEDGILHLELPKSERVKPRKIVVE